MSDTPDAPMPPAHPFDFGAVPDIEDGDKLKEECGVFGVLGTMDGPTLWPLDCTRCNIEARKRAVS